MSSRLEKLASVGTLLCAVAAVGISARAHLGPSRVGVREKPPATLVAGWRSIADSGMFLGTADAPVVLTEFTDFECPFCAQFHKATFSLKKRFGDRLAISLVHFPLPMHREARSAAAVAECAHAQGRGMQMSDILFLHQDSLGRQPPQWFSRAASVPDTAEFSRCVSSEVTGQRVERGYQIAQRLNISATPTIVLNGWKYGGVPSDSELVADIESLLAQREPHRGMRTLRSTFK